MSDGDLRVELDSSFSDDQVLQIRARLSEFDDVVVRSGKRELGLYDEIVAATPIIGAVVGLANLLLNIYVRVDTKVAAGKMDLASFKKKLDTELAKLGLLNCKITSLEDFEVITNGAPGFARLVVTDDSGKEAILRVERSSNTLRVALL